LTLSARGVVSGHAALSLVPEKGVLVPTAVEDILESVTTGVLRALDARSKGSRARVAGGAEELVRSGFNVSIVIRAGGIPPDVFLNPQPLPPAAPEREG
jgi:hypothetical protein